MSASSRPAPRNVPARARLPGDRPGEHPLFAVWEVTLHCDQPCGHCGTRAGTPRERELSTEEALDVADALAGIGCREVTLIGGEAYLRADLPLIVERLATRGIHVGMQTGGRGLKESRLRELVDRGLSSLGVSVDGLEATHDEIRGNHGSFRAAMGALELGRALGLGLGVNTQVNRLTYRELRPLARALRERAVRYWQVALMVPMGRAAERPAWLLDPWHVIDVVEDLAFIQVAAARAGQFFDVQLANNLGYYGPHEHVLRSRQLGQETHWYGCTAGIHTIALESDGTVKGCPSLPTSAYAGGNVRDATLRDLWQSSDEIAFARRWSADELWGRCRDCYYADVCRGGCNWMSHSLFGRRGNNPYCYFRADELQKQGLRERLVMTAAAPGRPFDHGRFEIVEEPWDTPEPPPRRRRLPVLGDDS